MARLFVMENLTQVPFIHSLPATCARVEIFMLLDFKYFAGIWINGHAHDPRKKVIGFHRLNSSESRTRKCRRTSVRRHSKTTR